MAFLHSGFLGLGGSFCFRCRLRFTPLFFYNTTAGPPVKNTFFIMRYLFSFLLVLIGTILHAQSQDTSFYSQPYKKRNSGSFGRSHSLLSFAYGFPNQLIAENNSGVYQSHSSFGPVIARLEFPVSDAIGIASQASYYRGKFTDFIGGVDKASILDLGAIGMYHFNKLIPLSKLDLYAGLGLKLSVANSQWNVGRLRASNLVSSGTSINAGWLAVAGVRYYLTPKFALFAEGGFPGGCYFDIGITFRLQ